MSRAPYKININFNVYWFVTAENKHENRCGRLVHVFSHVECNCETITSLIDNNKNWQWY